MKNLTFLFLVCTFFNINVNLAQIFSQNFDSSTTLSDYYNSTPSTNQFHSISTSGIGATVSVSSNALVMSRISSTSNVAYAERNVDFTTIPTGMIFKFDLTVSGNTVAGTNAFSIYVGGSVISGSTAPTVANTFAKFGINVSSTDGQFQIRDITNTTNGAHTYSGTQTITWVLNNTGFSQSYLSPSGSTETVANDKVDIWVGSVKEFDDINVATSTQTLARFKFLADQLPNDNCSITIDNIVIDNETALPVQITKFYCLINNKFISLNWITATEVNNYGFAVERRSDLENDTWGNIGFVSGHGNTNSPKEYSFIDYNFPAGNIFYRLRQIDFDGKFEYSNSIQIKVEPPDLFIVLQNYPNPFNPTTTIKYELPIAGFVIIKIFDFLGREVATLVNQQKPAGIHSVIFDGRELPSGVYVYNVRCGKSIQIYKMILIK